MPTRFLDTDEHDQQLRRCLNDDTLPLTARISAALTRLYALNTARITGLTTDRFHRDDDGAYLNHRVGSHRRRHVDLVRPGVSWLSHEMSSGLGLSFVAFPSCSRQSAARCCCSGR
jgi:hypothetical protein